MKRRTRSNNIPFIYQRGNLRLEGSTDNDRKVAKTDTILYRICQLIVALTFLLTAIYNLLN